MKQRHIGRMACLPVLITLVLLSMGGCAAKGENPRLAAVLVAAGENRGELERALRQCSAEERVGMAFLLINMPEKDRKALTADYLLENTRLAYRARRETPWGQSIPEELFLNDVLPYAHIDETRDPWRRRFFELCMPLVKECRTPEEAVRKLNSEIFGLLKVKYSTRRRAANQSARETLETGMASCTGLSIVLACACRAVGVPARLAGIPLWPNNSGNHMWVEVWDKGWHFTGAAEQDPKGLDRGWFANGAAEAKKDVREHAIYAASFKRTGEWFPLTWAMDNQRVPAENVTDRYARKVVASGETARLLVRVLDAAGQRVARPVWVTGGKTGELKKQGTSRTETNDANDLLTFELPRGKEFEVAVGYVRKAVHISETDREQLVEIRLAEQGIDAKRSAEAIRELGDALKVEPVDLEKLAGQPFAGIPLTRPDATMARGMLWQAHLAKLKKERAAEMEKRELTDGKLKMPFYFTIFGREPASGYSLWISLHGGGSCPAKTNDEQYENQKRLYSLNEGIYLAPRAPTNNWNMWFEPHMDYFYARVIEDFVALKGVDPDRVYIMGYSAGGDGIYQMAPRMPDWWAGAAMMAGHPNGVSMLSIRNVPFALQVGANDYGCGRNKAGREYAALLDKLQKDDPEGYPHFVRIREGLGHWMKLKDREALPWLANFSRNPIPERVVWKQTGMVHDRSYWLAVPKGTGQLNSLVIASRQGQKVTISTVDKVERLIVRLDDRMLDLDKPVVIQQADKTLHQGFLPRTIATLARTLTDRGDSKLMFDAEVAVELSRP